MQIFSPSASFTEIANCLDSKRLNKQKVEIFQILKCISLGDKAKGWKNHPAVLMAKNHELFFIEYGLTIANKCLEKGWKDTLIPKFLEFKRIFKQSGSPAYWGNEAFHSSHRAALLFKNPVWYNKFGWTEEPKIEYVWPIKK